MYCVFFALSLLRILGVNGRDFKKAGLPVYSCLVMVVILFIDTVTALLLVLCDIFFVGGAAYGSGKKQVILFKSLFLKYCPSCLFFSLQRCPLSLPFQSFL